MSILNIFCQSGDGNREGRGRYNLKIIPPLPTPFLIPLQRRIQDFLDAIARF